MNGCKASQECALQSPNWGSFKICLLWILSYVLFCHFVQDCYVENTTPISGSWRYSLEFHGSVTLLNVSFHFTEKVTDWWWASLTPCLCTRPRCAIASTNCKTYKQIFKNAGVHLKTKTSSYSVPAWSQCSSRSHGPETGLGAEVGYRLCFFLSNSCCLLRNEAPTICESRTAQEELEFCCRTDPRT